MNKVDVLNLEIFSYGSRDREMATLVCNYLRYQSLIVEERSIYNWRYNLYKTKPKLLFTCSSSGSLVNHLVIKYAAQKNIKILTLISEGNLSDDSLNDIWGWNKDQVLYEDYNLHWTERAKNIMIKYCPEVKPKLGVSGAVGFDKYKILTNSGLNFLKKYNKENYSKVVGFACWVFGPCYEESIRHHTFLKLFGSQAVLDRFQKDSLLLNKILIEIVKTNPDILFIIKEHPGNKDGKRGSAIEGLNVFDNIIIIQNEESVVDCISVSDLWLCYDSTTAMEAWLLNKPTGLINPSGIDFPRKNVHKGSPNFENADKLNNAIRTFYLIGQVIGFEELEFQRQKIIEETIQWQDGLNHVRAGNVILDILETMETKKVNFSLKEKLKIYQSNFYWLFAKQLGFITKQSRFKSLYKSKTFFNQKEINSYAEKTMDNQIAFYKKLQLDKKKLRTIKAI